MIHRFTRSLIVAGLFAVTAAPAQVGPHLDLERLRETAPGWLLTNSEGDATTGSVEAEQAIWPMWYLHWMPLSVGDTLSAKEARRAVERLWEEPILDEAVDPEPISLPAHEGFTMESTTSHGERKSRYFVWACPESKRLIVVDTSVNLRLNAPPELLEWQRDMAHTVRCHEGAPVESFPLLKIAHEIPDVGLGYSHPLTWRPLQETRVVKRFGETDMAIQVADLQTPERGQELVLALDALRRIHFEWRPEYDFPLSYDVLDQRVEDHWRGRSVNVMVIDRKVSNDVWIADGIVRVDFQPREMPPTHMHKFRAWLWRKEGVEYLAVGDVAGVRFGRQRPPLPGEVWNLNLEEMFQACRH